MFMKRSNRISLCVSCSIGDLPANTTLTHQIQTTPYRAGLKTVVADFDCSTFRDVKDSCTVYVKPWVIALESLILQSATLKLGFRAFWGHLTKNIYSFNYVFLVNYANCFIYFIGLNIRLCFGWCCKNDVTHCVGEYRILLETINSP